MRVGIIALQHESNTFISGNTTLADFEHRGIYYGNEVRDAYEGGHHEVAGFFEQLKQEKIDAVPIIVAQATPGATMAADAADFLIKAALKGLEEAGRLDGLLVAPHGAGVAENHRDFDGHWLTLVRKRVGRAMPMICTLDPHANVSERMIKSCNATITYRSNPHLDQRAVGMQAASLMARTLRGEIQPVQAAALPPIAINIERQYTQDAPCRPMYDFADSLLKRKGVLSNSIILGFPYADVEEMGSGFIVVADAKAEVAQNAAMELAQYLANHRAQFVGEMISVDQAVDRALAIEGPVCLLDMGDNVGGGAPADSTFFAHALHARGDSRKSLVCLFDPESAQAARAAGVGKTLELSMGGKTDDNHGKPLTAKVKVISLHDGKFEETEARHGGHKGFDMGPTAVVETDSNLTILLTSRRVPPFSLGQITSCGIKPEQYQILVAKGVNAPAAAYGPVCKNMMRVNSDGSTCADMLRFTYKHRRKPLFPFEDI